MGVVVLRGGVLWWWLCWRPLQQQRGLQQLLVLVVLVATWSVDSPATAAAAAAATPRFLVSGPVVTVTMKEPVSSVVHKKSSSTSTTTTKPSTKTTAAGAGAAASTTSAAASTKITNQNGWIHHEGVGEDDQDYYYYGNNNNNIQPCATWSIQTAHQPLPRWLPSLKQVRALVGYEYHRFKYGPSWLETTYKFSTQLGDLVIQPIVDRKKPMELNLRFSRGSSHLAGRCFFLGGGRGLRTSSNTDSNKAGAGGSIINNRILQALQGSFFFHFPNDSVRTLRVTPSVDFSDPTYPDMSCCVEATTGGAGRTKAILNLEYNNPTLAVEHRLDRWNTVRPCISIWNARITYQWDLKLNENGESAIRTIVDPLDAIHVTWTDESAQGTGSWITHFRLPLEGTTISALAADVTIRRQFKF